MEQATEFETEQAHVETMAWHGTTLRIIYKPHYLGLSDTAHIEVHVAEPQGAPLPITGTGYRSHFLDAGVVEECGSASAYVQRWLDQEALSPDWIEARAQSRQLSLF